MRQTIPLQIRNLRQRPRRALPHAPHPRRGRRGAVGAGGQPRAGRDERAGSVGRGGGARRGRRDGPAAWSRQAIFKPTSRTPPNGGMSRYPSNRGEPAPLQTASPFHGVIYQVGWLTMLLEPNCPKCGVKRIETHIHLDPFDLPCQNLQDGILWHIDL